MYRAEEEKDLKAVLQVLLGLFLCALLADAWLYLGPFWESFNPDGSSNITWRTGLAFVLLIAATQWISSYVFRRRVALPVFIGLALYMIFEIPLFHSSISFFWERHFTDGTFTVGWRSDGLFFLLIAATQVISFLTFRWIKTAT